MLKKNKVDIERARRTLEYRPDTGTLTWRKTGKIAGTYHLGYFRVRVGGRPLYLHRVVWCMVNGELDDSLDIDHVNGDRGDNRIVNLRVATRSENQQNQKRARSNNKYCKLLGVSFRKKDGKFGAAIRLNKRSKYLGIYATEEEAHQAYLTAKRTHHEFCTI